jgi:carboxyl-terminal processing protease
MGSELGLKLTIARYYTPSGRSIQEKGVRPDILLDEYDSKALAKAKIKQESFREKDLKGHMVNNEAGEELSAEELSKRDSESGSELGAEAKKDRSDYRKEEVDALIRDGKRKKDGEKEDDMTPLKFNPKEDYQVKEAMNYLRSYELFKKMLGGQPQRDSAQEVPPGQRSAQK